MTAPRTAFFVEDLARLDDLTPEQRVDTACIGNVIPGTQCRLVYWADGLVTAIDAHVRPTSEALIEAVELGLALRFFTFRGLDNRARTMAAQHAAAQHAAAQAEAPEGPLQ